ncbi:Gfo/Idh/MocA family protein [Chloroflexota bacterium]
MGREDIGRSVLGTSQPWVTTPLRVGVVGCGVIGKRRAHLVQESSSSELLIVADVNEGRARELAREAGCAATTDWEKAVGREDIDVVVVATVNKVLMPIAVAALESGKHVLCEKPPGRNLEEACQMADAARESGRLLKIGFNHRHHPAIWKAHELCAQGAIGPVMFIRAVYGHGGRPGYEKEWRGDAELAGGGELLDQGVHVVDLCRWFMGEFVGAFGCTGTYFWELGSTRPLEDDHSSGLGRQLEDNAFVLLRTVDGRIAHWHTSWTQWKNRFSFEVFGRDGYLLVNGLGGSYGTEALTVGHRRPESGPPIEERFEFNGPDLSWQVEWQEFVSAIRNGRQPLASGEDGVRTMRTVAAIYESARTGQLVDL